ncbi:hypothetical protein AB0911_12175 [Streptomyces nigra]|uniref:DUF6907 domain-containing protein n=1 Tax=Streptomyces nigra TaxID=1827580 RepID=UPI003453FF8D
MNSIAQASTATPTRGDQRTGVTVAIGAAPSLVSRSMELWATPDMDDYAYEAVYDPSCVSLAEAEASVRAQLAEYGVQVAGFLNEDGPLTAQQRGTEWMARYGCTPWCINDHSTPLAADWHTSQGVESTERDIDSGRTAPERAQLPFLAAQTVVHNDKPQAYGRTTNVWLHYGPSTGELPPAEARKILDSMRRFVADFETVVAHAEQSALDDFKGDPEIAAADREAEDRRISAVTAGRA